MFFYYYDFHFDETSFSIYTFFGLRGKNKNFMFPYLKTINTNNLPLKKYKGYPKI